MNSKKKWDGYTSWSYLHPGEDFDEYPLVNQLDAEPYDFGLTKNQEDHVEEFIEKNLIMSLHEHLNVTPPPGASKPRKARSFKGFEGLAFSGLDVVFDNCVARTMDEALDWLGMSLCDYAHQELVVPVMTVDDITRAHREGKVAVVHTMEQASAIDRDVDRIDFLFGLGVRSMGLVYSESNMLGSGCYEIGDGGVTDYGYDAITRMNRTGILLDISHAGVRTAMEAIEASDKPVFMSHCGSRTLTNSTRFLPDEVLKACAEKGGIVGGVTAGSAPRTKKHPEASIEGTLDHIKYLMEILGADHVGVGPDTMWGDHAGLYRKSPGSRGGLRHTGRPSLTRQRPETETVNQLLTLMELVKDVDHVKGLKSPSEFTNIIRGLVRDGYSDDEIKKVVGLNGMRVIKQCWPK